ncbi:MAG: AAA family ATPase [Gammaproteobacteria bacterium]|nr:AAA family ATPase [Gammaproteobacteria bacterium]
MHNRKPLQHNSQSLIEALKNPDIYDHPVSSFTILETHISWIILTGEYAYKIKKPVNFGFVNFSTLEKRKYYCEEELRLNRKFSEDIYLQVKAIRGNPSAPQLSGDADIIEYAVKMREFSQNCLLSRYAEQNRLQPNHVDSMAIMVCDIHRQAARAEARSLWGSAETIEKWSEENFQQIEKAIPRSLIPNYFDEMKMWCRNNLNQLRTQIVERQQGGFVRECHGDLHLGNMAYLNDQCTAFDCIEFNEELRWIDTMSEVAFVIMDLQARGYDNFAWRFLNHTLAISGDYKGLALLPYYTVYRALVRAKVEALLVDSQTSVDNGGARDFSRSMHFLELTKYWSRGRHPRLIVMHGLSGSGKSTVAQDLASRIGAIHIRSDVERKRKFNLHATSKSGSSIDAGIYNKNASQQTYRQLVDIGEGLLTAGFNVIIDAACLQLAQRTLFRQLAQKLQLPCYLISCVAPVKVLHERIARRTEQGMDASEANHEVLENQLKTQQPLSRNELDNPNTLLCNQARLSNKQLNLISADGIHY